MRPDSESLKKKEKGRRTVKVDFDLFVCLSIRREGDTRRNVSMSRSQV